MTTFESLKELAKKANSTKDEIEGLRALTYISTKYPEIEDYLENVDNLYDGLKEDEYEYMKDLIKYSMYSKSIVFELTKHPSVDEIIDEYINKNI